MQEKFKGRHWFTDEVIGSTYGGWGLSRDWEIWVERKRPGGPSRRTLLTRRFAGWETGDPPLDNAVLAVTPFFDRSTAPQLYSSSAGEGSNFLNSTDENDQRWSCRLMARRFRR